MNYYRLHINCKPDRTIYDSISRILDVTPMPFVPVKGLPELDDFSDWTYGLEERDDDEHVDFINVFIDLLEPNLSKLKELDISTENILIWLLYEYEHQCAMEFHPKEMLRLGKLGIHLNIDCWEK